MYPYFLRSIPSDTLTAKALATVIAHFGWPGVGIVHTSDPFGAGAAAIVEEQARVKGSLLPKPPSKITLEGTRICSATSGSV